MSLILETCSNEVIENVTRFLPLLDICNLRLSSRVLAIKTTQSHFKSYFYTKRVDVPGTGLQALVEATNSGSLGCLVQNLVLIGVVNNTKLLESEVNEDDEEDDEEEEAVDRFKKSEQDLGVLRQRQAEHDELHKSGKDVSLLSQAFSNIAASSKNEILPCLSLEVTVYRKDAETTLQPLAG